MINWIGKVNCENTINNVSLDIENLHKLVL